ncbi:MAG: UPF0262 family protein [Pseudomonadota bacterium]
MSAERHRIIKITLDEQSVVRRSPEIEQERAVAIYDLIEENIFVPKALPDTAGAEPGPFHINLGIQENRLIIGIHDEASVLLDTVILPLSPFRRVVRDYFMICESYYNAIRTASPSQIEAIDMGRRGLHNEGSELLIERLADRIEIDKDTARRLFTLVCVLHIRA